MHDCSHSWALCESAVRRDGLQWKSIAYLLASLAHNSAFVDDIQRLTLTMCMHEIAHECLFVYVRVRVC